MFAHRRAGLRQTHQGGTQRSAPRGTCERPFSRPPRWTVSCATRKDLGRLSCTVLLGNCGPAGRDRAAPRGVGSHRRRRRRALRAARDGDGRAPRCAGTGDGGSEGGAPRAPVLPYERRDRGPGQSGRGPGLREGPAGTARQGQDLWGGGEARREPSMGGAQAVPSFTDIVAKMLERGPSTLDRTGAVNARAGAPKLDRQELSLQPLSPPHPRCQRTREAGKQASQRPVSRHFPACCPPRPHPKRKRAPFLWSPADASAPPDAKRCSAGIFPHSPVFSEQMMSHLTSKPQGCKTRVSRQEWKRSRSCSMAAKRDPLCRWAKLAGQAPEAASVPVCSSCHPASGTPGFASLSRRQCKSQCAPGALLGTAAPCCPAPCRSRLGAPNSRTHARARPPETPERPVQAYRGFGGSPGFGWTLSARGRPGALHVRRQRERATETDPIEAA